MASKRTGTLITSICLLMSSWNETRGELLESVGHLKQVKDHDVIECNFHVEVTLSHVSFIDTEEKHVFGVVNCVTSCEVHNNYKDRLRIVSPHNTSLGNSFVFELSGSGMTAGLYTCYGLPKPQGVSPARDHDDDGEESQTTTLAQDPKAGGVSQSGSSNGLAALIISILALVVVVVVLLIFLLRQRRALPIPCLRDTSVVNKSLNNGPDEETPDHCKALLGNGSNSPLHHGAAQRGDVLKPYSPDFSLQFFDERIVEGKDDEDSGVKGHQELLQVSSHKVEYTKNKNTGVDVHQGSTHSSFSKAEKEQTKEEMEKKDYKEDDDNEVESDEAVREPKLNTRAETVQTGEELEKMGCNEDDDFETDSDDDDDGDADRSRNDEGAVDVDKLDGSSSTGQNLVYTDLSNPEQSQECSDGEKRQTIRRRLKRLYSKFNQFDDDNLDL